MATPHRLLHTLLAQSVSQSRSCNRWSHCGWHDGRDTPARGTCMQRREVVHLIKRIYTWIERTSSRTGHHIRVGDGTETTGLGGVIGEGPTRRLLARSQGPCSLGFDDSIAMKALAGGASELKNDTAVGAGISVLRMDRAGARLGTGGCGRTCLGVSR